jgi:methylase of polypeptide subunit release factors
MIELLRETKRKIQTPEQEPFIWDIDFAELFGDKGGFDIVIGNPPYVRQEKIATLSARNDKVLAAISGKKRPASVIARSRATKQSLF